MILCNSYYIYFVTRPHQPAPGLLIQSFWFILGCPVEVFTVFHPRVCGAHAKLRHLVVGEVTSHGAPEPKPLKTSFFSHLHPDPREPTQATPPPLHTHTNDVVYFIPNSNVIYFKKQKNTKAMMKR